MYHRYNSFSLDFSTSYIYYENMDLSRFQKIEVDKNMAREDIEGMVDLELETVENQMPAEEALESTQKEAFEQIQKDIDENVIEEEMGLTADDFRKEFQRISDKIGENMNSWKQSTEKKLEEIQKEIEGNGGVLETLKKKYEEAEKSVKDSIQETIVKSLEEDIKKKTNGYMPDSWARAQAEFAYNNMNTTMKMSYLTYIGASGVIALPGKVWNFMKDLPDTVQKKYDQAKDKIKDISTKDADDTTASLTPEEKTFWDKALYLPQKISDRIFKGKDGYGDKVLDYLQHNYREMSDVPQAWENSPWFDASHIPAGALAGVYLASFSDRPSLMKSFTWAALVGGLTGVPKITAPALAFTTAAAKGTGRIIADGARIPWNAFMSPVRGLSYYEMFTNPRFALDGDWSVTRQQRDIVEHLHELDEETRHMVPGEISRFYNKILKEEPLEVAETRKAAEFCVKSLDEDVYMGNEEFIRLSGVLMQNGGEKWNKTQGDQILRMLNTAYQKRIMTYFLGLEDTDRQKILFKEEFKRIFAERQFNKARGYFNGKGYGLEGDELDLKELYKGKVDHENMHRFQRKGIFGDVMQNKSGMGTLLMPVFLLYMLTSSLFAIKNKLDKKKEKKGNKENEKTMDGITSASQGEIAKELNKDKPDRNKILKVLREEHVIDKKTENELKKISKNDFGEALKTSSFPQDISSDLATVSRSLWDALRGHSSASTQVRGFDKIASAAIISTQVERINRLLYRGDTTSQVGLTLQGGSSVDIYELQKVGAGNIKRGNKKFSFKGRIDNKEVSLKISSSGDKFFIEQTKGEPTSLKSLGKVEIAEINF